jgi:hypothetical protein
MAVFKDIPNFTMCLGPGCDSGQIYGGGHDQPIMTCTTCKFKTCFTHQLPWHAGQTCDEYDEAIVERLMQEEASMKLIGKISKICPTPSCGANIQKSAGCDHMTCEFSRLLLCRFWLNVWI